MGTLLVSLHSPHIYVFHCLLNILRSLFFFGGLSIHLTQALLAHLFSYNITWGATKKEVEKSNFWLEVPKILQRFWLALSLSFVICVAMVVLSTDLVPPGWQILGTSWAVIFPLAITLGCHILYPVRFSSDLPMWTFAD